MPLAPNVSVQRISKATRLFEECTCLCDPLALLILISILLGLYNRHNGKRVCDVARRFFGGGFPGFGGFGGMGDEEEQTPKGDDVRVDLEVTLKDLYLGHQFKVGS